MPKWSSPIYDDVRNALGNSIVFSDWKGRKYFRRWVKPYNPNTLAQRAHRDHMRHINRHWDLHIITIPLLTVWNLLARDRRISGFNLFVSLARLARIRTPPTATTTATVPPTITISGINPLPPEPDPANPLNFISPCRIFREIGGVGGWVDITPAEGLPFGAFSFSHTLPLGVATYFFSLAHAKALPPGQTPPILGQIFSRWDLDLALGVVRHPLTEVTTA